MLNTYALAADRKYFYILENAYTRNTPTCCYFIPDNCCCPGDDTIEWNFFDRGLYNKEGYIGLRGLFRLTEIGRVERVFQVKKITRKKFITVEREPENFN